MKRDPPPPLEAELGRLQEEAVNDPEMRRHLIAVRFYLRDAIADHAIQWVHGLNGPTTNYVRLLRELGRWRLAHNEPVLLATFNYDLVLDIALMGHLADSSVCAAPENYVKRDDWKLLKLHGSTNWDLLLPFKERAFEGPPNPSFGATTPAGVVIGMGDRLLLDGDRRVVNRGTPTPLDQQTLRIPALALPTVTKSTFETHPAHRMTFEKAISSVDRLLVIGWRAAEEHVLEHLKALPNGYRLGVVSWKDDGVYEVLENLGDVARRSRSRNPLRYADGFSQFLLDGDDQLGWWLNAS